MRLYLARHGEAVRKDIHPNQPLSDLGRKDVTRLAFFLAGNGVRVSRVLHSGKHRAQETAMIHATLLGPGPVVEESPYPISPGSPTNSVFDALRFEIKNDVMIVGHLPYMDKLLSRLITGNETETYVRYDPGTIVALERRTEISMWEIIWAMSPGLISEQTGDQS